jgi:hypothetical protein
MKQHEREFFISSVRSGKVLVKTNNIKLHIIPATFDQVLESCEIYNEAYENAFIQEIMCEDDMDNWMREHEIWTTEDDNKIKGLKNDIERLKVEIYNARYDDNLKPRIRLYIRAGEQQLSSQLNIKHQYYQNTCEGVATAEKMSWLIKNTTLHNNRLYDFADISLSYVIDQWQSSIIAEPHIRELARSEPWRSMWIVHEKGQVKLFNNPPETDCTINQKNLLVWSQMYDNIHESIDCPSKEVIEDDDMLDGWFLIQAKKRDSKTAEQEFDKSVKSDKIKKSGEVYVMANNKKQVDRVNSLNSTGAKMDKQQRMDLIKNQGSVTQDKFTDVKRDVGNARAAMFKNKFKRK